jgi:hypothetical protein
VYLSSRSGLYLFILTYTTSFFHRMRTPFPPLLTSLPFLLSRTADANANIRTDSALCIPSTPLHPCSHHTFTRVSSRNHPLAPFTARTVRKHLTERNRTYLVGFSAFLPCSIIKFHQSHSMPVFRLRLRDFTLLLQLIVTSFCSILGSSL